MGGEFRVGDGKVGTTEETPRGGHFVRESGRGKGSDVRLEDRANRWC